MELDCALCVDDPERRRSLGCGRPPIIPIRDGGLDLEVEWTKEFYLDATSRAQEERTDKTASGYWAFSTFGGISEMIGLWPCCPRYFDVYCDSLVSHCAHEALDLAWWMESGELSAVARLPLDVDTSRNIQVAVSIQRTLTRNDMEASREPKGSGE